MIPKYAPNLDELFGSAKRADDARVILQYLFRMRMLLKKNKNIAPEISRDAGWCPVNSRNLFKLLSNRYKDIMSTLEENGIIEAYVSPVTGKKTYAPGVYTMKYRVLFGPRNEAGQAKYRVEKITTHRLIKRVVNFYRRDYDRQVEELLNKAPWFDKNISFMDSLVIDERAIQDVSNMENSEQLLATIDEFNNETSRFISKDQFAGRIHSYCSSLPKELRQFLRVQNSNDQLLLIDVKSAQPFLLGALFLHPKLIRFIPEFEPIIHKITDHSSAVDVRLFFEDCANGSFYSKWVDALGVPKSEAKELLFRHLLYCSASNQHKDEKVKSKRLQVRMLFESMYPTVFKILTTLKRTRSKTLPFVAELTKRGNRPGRMYVTPNMMAQKLEVAILLNLITLTCVSQGVYSVTIHDAWIIRKTDLETFMQVFKESFRQLGIKPPQLEIEEIGLWNNNMELLNSERDEATD